MLSAFDLAQCIGCGLAMLIFYSVLLRRASLFVRHVLEVGSLRQKLSHTLRQLRSCAKHKSLSLLGNVKDPKDPTAARIQELVTDYQIKCLEAYSLHLAFLLIVPAHFVFSGRLQGQAAHWHSVQLVIITLAALVHALMAASSSCISRSTIPLWFHSMTALAILFGCFGLDTEHFLLSGAISSLVRICLGAFHLHVPSLVPWNIIYVFAAPFSMWSQGFINSSEILRYLHLEFWMTLIVVLCVYGWDCVVHLIMNQRLELSSLENAHGATSSLLKMFCDLSIVLDEELIIIDNHAALAAMLMYADTKSFEGKKMDEFFATDEDSERFKTHVLMRQASVGQDQSIVTAIHFGLQDALGNAVQVEAFFALFRGLCGEARYLVGIREFPSHIVSAPSPLRQWEVDPVVSRTEYRNEWKGTPCQRPPSDLPPADSLEQSSSSTPISSGKSGRRRRHSKSLVPSLRPTSMEAKSWAVVNSLLQVNWEFTRQACCNFHASVRELRSELKVCLTRRCLYEFADATAIFDQCPRCGILNLREEIGVGAKGADCGLTQFWNCPLCEPRESQPDLDR